MPVQVTIIGLGQIGASIGLALGKIKDQAVRIGNDRDPGVARQAERAGAVDKTMINLPSAVKDADIVVLAVPVDEIHETLEVIAPDLKPGVVVINTGIVQGPVFEWAKELLPGDDRYFASLTPTINPDYLMHTGSELTSPHADLFHNSLMLIATLPGIDDSAVSLVTNLTQILGATPLYTEAIEADGLMAYSHVLPRLTSVALTNATMEQPGWREARKIASHAYAQLTEPALHPEESKSFGQAALLNRDNTLRMLDQLIMELRTLRTAIAEGDETTLQERFENARSKRELWWKQRLNADWEPKAKSDIPTGGEIFGRLFGIRPRNGKK
jgi:prephenate dehydrogenase